MKTKNWNHNPHKNSYKKCNILLIKNIIYMKIFLSSSSIGTLVCNQVNLIIFFPNKKNKENKLDFNIDLITANSNKSTSAFLNIIYSSYLNLHMIFPTRLTSIPEVPDHLGWFLILPQASITPGSKEEHFERSFKHFIKNNLLADLKK